MLFYSRQNLAAGVHYPHGVLGSDDLFTKATLDASVKNMDRALDQGIPDDARQWLGMMGFRVVVNLRPSG